MMQKMLKKIWPLIVVICVAICTLPETGCKKDTLLESGGEVRFSTDTLSFDTVFTSIGSFTAAIKIFNPQNQKIVLSSVRMEQGNSSFFRLNVDGFAGNDVKNIEVAANDSVYVFATVKIDPTSANSPFFIQDKLIATLNGNNFSIPVTAYGQNAYYVINHLFEDDTVWKTDKPYVIINSAQIAAGKTLTIPAGSRVYMNRNSRLFVSGTLKVMGTPTDSVVFQGDRLDRAYFGYEGYPGEWGGIYFDSRSVRNELNYTLLKNGGNDAFGFQQATIQVNPDSVADTDPQLSLNSVTIQNSYGFGLLSFNGTVNAVNCLVHTCGAEAVALLRGGRYRFDNCTIANYGSDKVGHVDRSALVAVNYFKENPTTLVSNAMDAVLRNCVVYGSLENEVVIDSISSAPCTVTLQNCVLKAVPNTIPSWVVQDNTVKYNLDPLFEKTETEKWNFRVKTGSPLIDAGVDIPSISLDLDGKPRRNGQQDIGAYEH